MITTRIKVSLCIASLAPIFAFLLGYDFDKRGVAAAYCFLCTLVFFFMAYLYPGKYKDES